VLEGVQLGVLVPVGVGDEVRVELGVRDGVPLEVAVKLRSPVAARREAARRIPKKAAARIRGNRAIG
jgi:hypothetical protein